MDKNMTDQQFNAQRTEMVLGKRIHVGVEYRDKFRSVAIGGLCQQIGMPGYESELAGRQMIEIARMSLDAANQDSTGSGLDIMARALTTSDFPQILAAVANKSLLEGFETAPETWMDWCGDGSVSDFKPNTISQVSGTGDLDEVPEGLAYKYGERSDSKESFSIATYGKILPITRQAIINDDLSALSDTPRAHGESAARKIGDLAYSVLTENPVMGDGLALFHVDHNNILSSAEVGVESIANGIQKMRTQKGIDGKTRLNIRPYFFIAPVALEGSSEIFYRSNDFADAAPDATRTNPYSGDYFQRVYDSRLDDDSETAWYLAGPKGKTVKLFFLGGRKEPILSQQPGWAIDGIEFKVSIDVAAKAVDYRAINRNVGL